MKNAPEGALLSRANWSYFDTTRAISRHLQE